jgi:hypothetical protein
MAEKRASPSRPRASRHSRDLVVKISKAQTAIAKALDAATERSVASA